MVTTKAAPSRPGPAASCWACTAPRTSLQPLTGGPACSATWWACWWALGFSREQAAASDEMQL